jgi:Na+/H+ antiporter NhaC
MAEWGMLSLAPMFAALVIAFRTKSAAFALLAGCIIGVILLGLNPTSGLRELFQRALGNGAFIQVNLIVCLLGILFALLKETGAIGSFAMQFSRTQQSPRRVAVTTWAMGFFIVDDYFSPLMTGAIMRPLTDSIRMSREKLAFILDSTTASVCILVPFAAWGAYFAGLILAQGGPVETPLQAMEIFIQAIPYNFYPILLIIFTLGICLRLIPDYGPMRLAERRAFETGALIRKGSTPLITTDSAEILANTSGSGDATVWYSNQ